MKAGRFALFGCGLLLALVTVSNAWTVLGFEFVAWDDDINVYLNPHLGPPGADALKWMWTDAAYMRRYVPLGWLGFSVVYGFSGLSPVGYHGANLVFHAANTLLLFAVLWAMVRRWGRATDGVWPTIGAALGAGLWALHPFRAETVGWASGLFYGPAGLLALVSVRAYLAALACERGSRARRGWVAATAVAYLGSLLAYPIGLGLIGAFVAIGLMERWHGSQGKPQASFWGDGAKEMAWLAVPPALGLVVTVVAGYGGHSLWTKPAALEDYGLLPRLAQAAYAGGGYIWRRFWPLDLTPAPTALLEVNLVEPVYWLVAAGLGAVTAGLWLRTAWRHSLLVGWGAFFALLFPVLGWTERPYFPSDRYDYLAGMVVSAVAALALARVTTRTARAACAGVLLAAIGALALLQQRQLEIWRTTDNLKRRMIDVSDNLAFRVMQYGTWAKYHAQRGRRARAEEIVAECRRACGDGPWLRDLRREVAEASSEAALHTRYAIDFSRAGRGREAEDHFRAALAIDPAFGPAAVNYAMVQAIAGKLPEALVLYDRAVSGANAEAVPLATRAHLLGLIAENAARDGARDRLGDVALRAGALAELAQAQGDTKTADAARELAARHHAAK